MSEIERWDDRLSEYLDGELDAPAVERLEKRLDEDPALRLLLEELRAVKQAAVTAPTPAAPDDLWDGIRQRIERERHRLAFTLPQLAAAAAIILFLGVSLGRMSTPEPAQVATQVPAATQAPGAVPAESGVTFARHVADLEARLDAGREVLDPATARVIEESLSKIDDAIWQARVALENDPNNQYLNQHLASARARKVRLLEDATTLIASRT